MDYEEHLEEIYEECYMEACELVSPNSQEFDELLDKLFEDAIECLGV